MAGPVAGTTRSRMTQTGSAIYDDLPIDQIGHHAMVSRVKERVGRDSQGGFGRDSSRGP
jgi:hypothetical protein